MKLTDRSKTLAGRTPTEVLLGLLGKPDVGSAHTFRTPDGTIKVLRWNGEDFALDGGSMSPIFLADNDWKYMGPHNPPA